MTKTVVVTGAATGLGREISIELLTRDRPVVLVDRDAGALETLGAELGDRFETPSSVVVAELSSLAGVRAAAEQLSTRADLGGLVNNAGGWVAGEQYPDAPPETWLSALTLNLITPMLLTQLLWSGLAANHGAVVNIGSSGGIGDAAYGSPEYGAAKAGLRRLTASLSDREDLRVMAVVPGWIGLDRAQREWAVLSAEQQRDVGPLVPPADVASMVARLLVGGRPGEVVEMLGDEQRPAVDR